MTESSAARPPGPLGSFRNYLDQGARTRHGIVRSGLDLLGRLLDDAELDPAESEAAEIALVYDVLASQTAEMSDLSVPQAFRALIDLCEDPGARRLVHAASPADPAQVAALRALLVWITVTYEQPRDGAQWSRQIEISARAMDDKVRLRKVTDYLGWDDLPGFVRERLLVKGGKVVKYQLYPQSDAERR